MKPKFISCFILSCLILSETFVLISLAPINSENNFGTTMDVTTTTWKSNWMRKLMGDFSTFRKSREEAYLSNIV